jgi:hypothetical protein
MTEPERPPLHEPTADDRDTGVPPVIWFVLAAIVMLIFAAAILYVGRG